MRRPLHAVDSTLVTILALLVFATIIAIVRARRRDRCLKGLADFHVTLSEQDGDLTWGRADVYSTGLEIVYAEPVVAPEGHLERSFIFYKDQYGAMEAVYRCPKGLSDAERERRDTLIARTAHPSLFRRFFRAIRTWTSMVRDALVQSVGLFVGLAKTRAPGSAVLGSQEKNVTALSSEIIGHVGNAYDPLLEHHLFTQVVVEVTSDATTRSYCGWLKNYTSEFITLLDAYANASDYQPQPVRPIEPGDAGDGLSVTARDGRVTMRNDGVALYYVATVEGEVPASDTGTENGTARTDEALSDEPLSDEAHSDEPPAERRSRAVHAVLPPGHELDVQLWPGTDETSVRVTAGTAERVDMVVPRRHALVRHAAGGSDETYQRHRDALRNQTASPPSTTAEDAEAAATDA